MTKKNGVGEIVSENLGQYILVWWWSVDVSQVAGLVSRSPSTCLVTHHFHLGCVNDFLQSKNSSAPCFKIIHSLDGNVSRTYS